MTTRSAPSAKSADRRRRFGWDVTLAVCAVAYLALVLFDDVESPLLSLALFLLVAYELIEPHCKL